MAVGLGLGVLLAVGPQTMNRILVMSKTSSRLGTDKTAFLYIVYAIFACVHIQLKTVLIALAFLKHFACLNLHLFFII